MRANATYYILIVGGGLAGLIAAIELGKRYHVLLLEKDSYPRHRVCGEYVSNEVLPYLQSIGIDPLAHGAKKIDTFQLSTQKGSVMHAKLPLGGFGMSRYALDALLYQKAKAYAAIAFTSCTEILFDDNMFTVATKEGTTYKATYVIGAFGKRTSLDKTLGRHFSKKKSPWLAVKAHYTYPFTENLVALHNFPGGYCGLSMTETDAVNACYLTTYKAFKQVKDINQFQQKILSTNPLLANFFKNAIPVFENPLSISQISFETKAPVENHIFMIGDAAGLIHPLCGNGMAMAIHSAKLLSDLFLQNEIASRTALETKYVQVWLHNFSRRLKTGRRVQEVLMRPTLAKTSFGMARLFPSILPAIIKKTHGEKII